MKVLGYKDWRYLDAVIEKAKISCKNSDVFVNNHFVVNNKMVQIGSGAQRKLTKKGNYSLNQAAKNAGVKKFDKFHNAGYKGLYNGKTADDIAKRKGLRDREDILDNMWGTELSANLFRISQTEEKLRNDKIQTEKEANNAHYNIGKDIREVIKKHGGTMPEDLLTPKKSLKQLEKENKRIKEC